MSKDIVVHKIPPSSRQYTKPTATKTLMHMKKKKPIYCDNDTKKKTLSRPDADTSGTQKKKIEL